MGRYTQDLEMISGLLGAGMTTEQGIDMLLQAKDAQQVRRDERQATLDSLTTQLQPMVASPDYSYKDIKQELGQSAPLLGINDRMVDKTLNKIKPLYKYGKGKPSILAQHWDAEDEATVAKDVQKYVTQSEIFRTDRALLREKLLKEYERKMGPRLLDDLRGNINKTIDKAFIQAGGIPMNDEENKPNSEYDPGMVFKAKQLGISPDEYQARNEGWIASMARESEDEGGVSGFLKGAADWVDDTLLWGLGDDISQYIGGTPGEEGILGSADEDPFEAQNLKSVGADLGQIGAEVLLGGALLKGAGAVSKVGANAFGKAAPGMAALVPRTVGRVGFGEASAPAMAQLAEAYGAKSGGGRLSAVMSKMGMGTDDAAATVGVSPPQRFSRLGDYMSDVRNLGRAGNSSFARMFPGANYMRGFAQGGGREGIQNLARVAGLDSLANPAAGAAAGSVVDDVIPTPADGAYSYAGDVPTNIPNVPGGGGLDDVMGTQPAGPYELPPGPAPYAVPPGWQPAPPPPPGFNPLPPEVPPMAPALPAASGPQSIAAYEGAAPAMGAPNPGLGQGMNLMPDSAGMQIPDNEAYGLLQQVMSPEEAGQVLSTLPENPPWGMVQEVMQRYRMQMEFDANLQPLFAGSPRGVVDDVASERAARAAAEPHNPGMVNQAGLHPEGWVQNQRGEWVHPDAPMHGEVTSYQADPALTQELPGNGAPMAPLNDIPDPRVRPFSEMSGFQGEELGTGIPVTGQTPRSIPNRPPAMPNEPVPGGEMPPDVNVSPWNLQKRANMGAPDPQVSAAIEQWKADAVARGVPFVSDDTFQILRQEGLSDDQIFGIFEWVERLPWNDRGSISLETILGMAGVAGAGGLGTWLLAQHDEAASGQGNSRARWRQGRP